MIFSDNEKTRLEAAKCIADGGIIAFRTDTFYGLGADPFNRKAVERIRALKGREETNPILLLIGDMSEVGKLIINRSKLFETVAQKFWPGPLTIVGTAAPQLPDAVTSGTRTIGVRLPAVKAVCELVDSCGGALTATSANTSGQPPSCSAKEVANYFSDDVDLIIDGGEVNVTEPSTVIDLSGAVPRLIREGAVTTGELRAVLHNLEIDSAIGK